MLDRPNDLNSCPLAYAISLFEGKWKPFIIWHISTAPEGVIRYGELKRSLPWKISHKMLSQHLHELEEAGIVNRKEYDEKPPRVEYSLTDKGSSLATIMYLIRDWGAAYGDFSSNTMLRSRGDMENGTITYARPKTGRGNGFAVLDRLATGDVGITWNCDFQSMIEAREAKEALSSAYPEPAIA